MSGCIYYFSTFKHRYTLGIYAAFYAKKPADFLRIIPYAGMPMIRSFGPGVFIFTDQDRINPQATKDVSLLADYLLANGCRVLNHPRRVKQRFDLLRSLHEAGLNNFNVYWLADWRKVERFPVFIRCERGHDAPVTKLIADGVALRQEAEELLAKEDRPTDLMIVEFGNALGADGRYRKYSAYKVGDHIYPQHCFSSQDWWIKFGDADLRPDEKQEHIEFLERNPHRDQLEKIFAIAGIEYGRADYCVVEGRVQTFEINTNPTVIQGAAGRLADLSLYVRLHDDAMMRLLATGSGGPTIPNPLFEAGGATFTPEEIHDELLQGYRSTGEKVRVPVDSSLARLGPQ